MVFHLVHVHSFSQHLCVAATSQRHVRWLKCPQNSGQSLSISCSSSQYLSLPFCVTLCTVVSLESPTSLGIGQRTSIFMVEVDPHGESRASSRRREFQAYRRNDRPLDLRNRAAADDPVDAAQSMGDPSSSQKVHREKRKPGNVHQHEQRAVSRLGAG